MTNPQPIYLLPGTRPEPTEKLRFPLTLDLTCTSRHSNVSGTTIVIGSNGCTARLTERLLAGLKYSLDISWPALLHDKTPLTLRIPARLDWINFPNAQFTFLSRGEFFTKPRKTVAESSRDSGTVSDRSETKENPEQTRSMGNHGMLRYF